MKKTHFTTQLLFACLLIFGMQPQQINAQTAGVFTSASVATTEDTMYQYIQAPNGDYYAFGAFDGTVNLDPSGSAASLTSNEPTMFLAKYDQSGHLWSKKVVEGYASVYGYGNPKMKVLSSGNLILTGEFIGTVDMDPGANTVSESPGSNRGLFRLELDANGDYVSHWALTNQFYSINHQSIDNTGNTYTLFQFEDQINVSSATTPHLIGSNGTRSFAVVKYDPQGNVVYDKTFSRPAAFDPQVAFDFIASNISVNAQGEIGLTIFSLDGLDLNDNGANMSLGTEDLAFLRLDASGNVVWRKFILTGMGDNHCNGCNYFHITSLLDDNGNLYSSGLFTDPINFDPANGSNVTSTTRESSLFVTKHNASGNLTYVHTIEGTMSFYRTTKMAVSSTGNLVLSQTLRDFNTVQFQDANGTVVRNPGPSTSGMYRNTFLQVLAPDGTPLVVSFLEADEYDSEFDYFEFDNNDNLLIAGTYVGNTDFDFGPGTDNRTGANQYGNLFFGKATTISTLNTEDITLPELTAQVYPNPFQQAVQINFEERMQDLNMTLMSADGKIITQKALGSGQNFQLTFDVEPGMYLLRYTTSNGQSGQKTLIKQ